ncbi:MAG TPA: transcriptional regulator BetI [Dongiaceae bacterium]|jgi:transcriptional repressor BetI
MPVNEPIRDRRRQALIKATIAVIAKHGASGTTVERVARKAGVSVGLMNFHFDSKERLFRETFRHLSEEYEEVWQQNLRAAGTGSRARLRQMIESNFDLRIFTREKLAVWFTFWSDAQLRDRYRAAAARVERRYIAAIEKEIAALLAGERRRKAAPILQPLMAMIDGFWLQALLYPRGFMREDAILVCLAFIDEHIGHARPRLPHGNTTASLSASV